MTRSSTKIQTTRKKRVNNARPDKEKARALAALLTGESTSSVSRRLKIPESTIRTWRDAQSEDWFAKLRENKNTFFDELLFDCLEAEMRARVAIAEHATDKKWLSQQTADDLGTFYGIMSDKNVRMLEAMQRADESKRRRELGEDEHEEDDSTVPGEPIDETRQLKA